MVARKPEHRRISVVKVQTGLSDSDAPALIYDQGREHMQQRKLDQTEVLQMKGNVKAFFTAWWSEATGWVLLSRATWKRW